MRICAVVPSHDHHRAIGDIVAVLRREDLPVYIVDDGSGPETASALVALDDPAGGVHVLRLPVNRGKGAAVAAGFRRASAEGFTHAVQIDADGQHDIAALPRLLTLARQHPDALISARPVYDHSAPLGRRIGRWLTHLSVFVETLSFEIRDSMCGFRIYPLAASIAVLDTEGVGERMQFDTEIMVRLFWRGVRVVHEPVRVIYPPGNTSGFDMMRDNAQITAMHLRLLGGMLRRLSRRLGGHAPRPTTHWASLQERGLYWGIRTVALAWRLLGRRCCLTVATPIVAYFYWSGREQRRASREFLRRAFAAQGRPREPTHLDGLRHFLTFTGRALDTFIGWARAARLEDFRVVDPAKRDAAEGDPRGCVLIVSHLGNVDLARAALGHAMRARLTVLVHTHHAVNYNRVLHEINAEAALNTVQVSDIGPDTAMALQDQVAAGQWLVIAGDRTPVGSQGHTSAVPFLGEPAAFPHGPFILAALMGCPVWLLFCRREGERHCLRFERLAERLDLPRGRRREALEGYIAAYAGFLQQETLSDPFQWYNFFDFWAKPAEPMAVKR
jgi:predicted LPLAT superfamily acyltransferase